MAKLSATSCPVCGAPAEIPPEAEQITCPYCRQTSAISKRRTASPDLRSPHPHPQQAPKAFVIAGIAAGIAVLVGVVLTTARSSTIEAIASGTKQLQFSDQPFLFDVNGDGVTDVLGRSRNPTSAWLAAYDGRDGQELWRTDPLTTDAADGTSLRALAGDKFISIDSLGKVQAYQVKTGQPAWAALVSDVADEVCQGSDFVRVRTRDKADHDFALATGQKVKGEGACHPVTTSRADASSGYRIVDWSRFPDLGLPRLNSIEGFSNHRALVGDPKSIAFMLGAPSTGSRVPMVAAVEGKKVLWKSVVPAVDPLTTNVNVTTQVAAYANGRLVVPYELKGNKGVRMAAFDARSGTRLWDVPVHDGTQVSHGIAVTDRDVYFATWTAVFVLKADTGELRWRQGIDF